MQSLVLSAQDAEPCGTHFFSFFFSHTFTFQLASGQAVVTGVVPFSPPVLAFNFYRA